MPLIEAQDLQRHYVTRGERVRALDGVSFTVEQGEVVALIGPSGSGKSTLLNLLGGLERPSAGCLAFKGEDLAQYSSKSLAAYRRRHVGMVFQSFNLIARMSALENVALPLTFDGVLDVRARQAKAIALLDSVGLGARIRHRPAELSGGEQQRVAIARALANGPALILADEPTGNLDSARAGEILELLLRLNREQGMTLLLVTHDPEVAKVAGRRITLRDGKQT